MLLLLASVRCRQQQLPETAESSPTATRATAVTRPTTQNTPSATVQNTIPAPNQPTAIPTAILSGEEAPQTPTDPGALIHITMQSQVGVLLDELPPAMRDQAAQNLQTQSQDFWLERANRQTQLTMYRLNFRNYIYEGKGQLPLPPAVLWQFELDPAGPTRQTIQGHDLVVINYTYRSTLLTDAASPGTAEPALAEPGGTWQEPFVLPIDPELLLQRTNNACINEAGFPPNSYDSENAWIFFDYACTAESGGLNGCHRTQLPTLSCQQAMEASIGTVATSLQFEHVAWDDVLAAQVRVGPVSDLDAPDLMVLENDLSNYRIIYRYFAPDSCALVEQCVGGAGWRRLLQFDATVYNVGNRPLHIGAVVAEDPVNFMFQYNACHNHFHFSNYGEFTFNGSNEFLTSKQAFCVESTERLSNNETSPLTHPYSCSFQGVQAGWVDEYQAGLDCQWIDITDLASDEPVTATLGFNSNTGQFICEGTPVLDEAGNVQWEPSGLTTVNGASINRPQCDFVPNWDANNSGAAQVVIPPTGGFVTAPCDRNHLGPLRNCGFSQPETAVSATCSPGFPVQLSCTIPDATNPQVIRVCEKSAVLGAGVDCVYQDALANVVVGDGAAANTAEITFTCPFMKDANEPGGEFVLYTAPLLPNQPTQPITCTTAP